MVHPSMLGHAYLADMLIGLLQDVIYQQLIEGDGTLLVAARAANVRREEGTLPRDLNAARQQVMMPHADPLLPALQPDAVSNILAHMCYLDERLQVRSMSKAHVGYVCATITTTTTHPPTHWPVTNLFERNWQPHTA